jgi:hypothetical protein
MYFLFRILSQSLSHSHTHFASDEFNIVALTAKGFSTLLVQDLKMTLDAYEEQMKENEKEKRKYDEEIKNLRTILQVSCL